MVCSEVRWQFNKNKETRAGQQLGISRSELIQKLKPISPLIGA